MEAVRIVRAVNFEKLLKEIMMPQTTDAQDKNRNDLIFSTEQLLRLLFLDAPAEIICNQVNSILMRTLMAYGNLTFTKIGDSIRRLKLINQGFCTECERQLDEAELSHPFPPQLCQACRDQFDREFFDPSMN